MVGDVLTRRVGQPGGGTDLEADEPKPLKSGDRLAPGGDARIFPLRGGEADRSHASIVRVPEEPGVEVRVRYLDPGDYVAIDEQGNERRFSVSAGAEDAVVQPGKGGETTGPGGAVTHAIETSHVGQVTDGVTSGEVSAEALEAAAKPVKPAAAARDNLSSVEADDGETPTDPPAGDPNRVGATSKVEQLVPGALDAANAEQREAIGKKPKPASRRTAGAPKPRPKAKVAAKPKAKPAAAKKAAAKRRASAKAAAARRSSKS